MWAPWPQIGAESVAFWATRGCPRTRQHSGQHRCMEASSLPVTRLPVAPIQRRALHGLTSTVKAGGRLLRDPYWLPNRSMLRETIVAWAGGGGGFSAGPVNRVV